MPLSQLKKAILLNPKQPAARLTLAAVYADTPNNGSDRGIFTSRSPNHIPSSTNLFLALVQSMKGRVSIWMLLQPTQKVITMGGRSARVHTGVARAYLALEAKKRGRIVPLKLR